MQLEPIVLDFNSSFVNKDTTAKLVIVSLASTLLPLVPILGLELLKSLNVLLAIINPKQDRITVILPAKRASIVLTLVMMEHSINSVLLVNTVSVVPFLLKIALKVLLV